MEAQRVENPQTGVPADEKKRVLRERRGATRTLREWVVKFFTQRSR